MKHSPSDRLILIRQSLWFLLCWLGAFIFTGLFISTLMWILKPETDFSYRKLTLALSNLLVFTAPALVFAYLIKKKKAAHYLYLHRLPSWQSLLLLPLIFILAYPIAMWLYYLNMQIVPSSWIAQNTLEMIDVIMRMNNPIDLVINVIMIGVIAGLGEELLFRGVIQRLVAQYIGSVHAAVWIGGILFSIIHFQPEGFIPRFLLGVLLGYTFIWTGSLWTAILGHIFFNSSQVIFFYFYTEALKSSKPEEMPDFPLIYSLLSVLIFIFACFVLFRTNQMRSIQPGSYTRIADDTEIMS